MLGHGAQAGGLILTSFTVAGIGHGGVALIERWWSVSGIGAVGTW